MPRLMNWCLLRGPDGGSFLAGECIGHPTIEDGPVITNRVEPKRCIDGAIVVSDSGTKYTLEGNLPGGDYPDFVEDLMLKRALDRLYRAGIDCSEELLQKLIELIHTTVRIR